MVGTATLEENELWAAVASNNMLAAMNPNPRYACMQEAAYVCQGTAGGVMGMATSQQDELWAAVAAGDGARVAAVSAALRLAPRARGDRQPTLPLRVYVRIGDVGAPAWPWPAFASVTSTRPPCLT